MRRNIDTAKNFFRENSLKRSGQFLRTAFCILLVIATTFSSAEAQNGTTIQWDLSTRKFASTGVYSRVVKLSTGELALVYSDGPDVQIRKSSDNGATWGAALMVAHTNGYNNTNASMVELQNGWLLYAWNGRPQTDGTLPYTIDIIISKDNGATWGNRQTLYTADVYAANACWEPSMLQLPSGEIQLFFSNENPFRTNADQEIDLMRSYDNGQTWTTPIRVSYRAGHRDGMPVPVYLNDNKGIAYSIEDNGLNGNFKPSIIWSSVANDWTQGYVNATSPDRWGALRSDQQLAASVYAGAPYLIQLPSGETVLSCQSNNGRANPIMQVYVGDYNAKNFAGATSPFSDLPSSGQALWNSLTVLNDTTIIASSSVNGLGQDGIWTVKGNVIRNKQMPYGNAPIPIPGRVEAEDFDHGGEAVAYHDMDYANQGGAFRTSEGVDIEVCSEGGYDVGWIEAGEWIDYTVNVTSSGTYTIGVRVSSINTGKSFHIEMNGTNVSGPISVPNTGDWQAWQTVTVSGILLTAGTQVMRIYMDTDGFNLNYVNFSLVGGQWTKAQANQWYQEHDWVVGCNFIPSTAVNQLEMWQAATFDTTTIDREMGYMESIGMNTARVFLHYLVWQQDWPGFRSRMEQYLQIADKHHIQTVFVLFDDCWNPDPKLGPQPAPIPGVHNSQWVQCPGDPEYQDTTLFSVFANYTRDIISYFKNDSRVLMWDLYNEAGNGYKGEKSFPLVKLAFQTAFGIRPSQPVTSCWWSDQGTMDNWELANSDIITFHYYNTVTATESFVNANLLNFGRPVICTEYMARTLGSTFQTVLPYFYSAHIGALNWGLVNGKTQTIYPWGSPQGAPEPAVWFHDVFHKDGTPFDKTETDMIRIYATLPKGAKEYDIVPVAQTWQYTLNQPASGWTGAAFDASSWTSGTAGFGTGGNTAWTSSDIWMQRTFTLPYLEPEALNTLFFKIYHDEDAEIYINGVLAASLKSYSAGYIYFPIDRAALLALKPGEQNVLTVHCHQTVGGQFIDVGLVNFMQPARSFVTSSQDAGTTWSYTTTQPAAGWNQIAFNANSWQTGLGGFGAGNPPNTFVRTTWNTGDIWIRKTFNPGSELPGDLTLRIYHDEDAEVYINGVLVQSLSGYVTSYDDYLLDQNALDALLPNTTNVLAIHCHQTVGGQYIDAGLFEPGPPVPVKENGIGLSGQYYNAINFTNEALLRLDTVIQFDWGTGSPDLSIRSDSFSVRWTGFIQPSVSGLYTFYINSDNGRKLIIDSAVVIDALINNWGIEYSGQLFLEGGQRYPIELDYFEDLGGASVKFEWACIGVPRAIVPSRNLWPDYNLKQPAVITGVTTASREISTVLYPNPAVSGFTIRTDSPIEHVRITDPAGTTRLEESLTGSEVYIEMNGWSRGMYFVRIKTQAGEVTRKLVAAY